MCTCFVLRIDCRKTSTSSVSIFALSLAFLEIQFSDLVGLLDGLLDVVSLLFCLESSAKLDFISVYILASKSVGLI